MKVRTGLVVPKQTGKRLAPHVDVDPGERSWVMWLMVGAAIAAAGLAVGWGLGS